MEAVLDFLPVFGVAKAAEKGLVKTLGAETVNGIENRLRGGVVGNAIENGTKTLSGQWKAFNESMSDFS